MSGFGDFKTICETAPLPLCANVGPVLSASGRVGIEPDCYARNIELANTIIFEGAASAMHIAALVMTVVMILHVRSKFTAVGRKEILAFFYTYMLTTFVSLVVDAGVVPPGSGAYPYFVSIQNGLSSALVTCLLVNGFVGFQLYEDGTPLSVWLLRLCSLAALAVGFLVSLATFRGWAGLGPANTVGLFVVLYLLNAIQLFIYVGMQVLLVTRTLHDRWPLGDIAFGVLFFVAGQVILYAFSANICTAVGHYLDGLFFATTCNLLAVMMVYKYWDSITREDLEFSVGTRMNNWEVKELLPDDDRRATMYADDPYGHPASHEMPFSPTAQRYSSHHPPFAWRRADQSSFFIFIFYFPFLATFRLVETHPRDGPSRVASPADQFWYSSSYIRTCSYIQDSFFFFCMGASCCGASLEGHEGRGEWRRGGWRTTDYFVVTRMDLQRLECIMHSSCVCVFFSPSLTSRQTKESKVYSYKVRFISELDWLAPPRRRRPMEGGLCRRRGHWARGRLCDEDGAAQR